ncbi:tRNA (guanosine(37)-N1)-methyltransferase TrmD [Candidatus Gottesmanbacteria bacterium]|nr:tRNA (guanosine(37)-N1)-methyltransferase TrmD [Candidatus Gottesmanbacteria bacterium]
MTITILSLFPEVFEEIFSSSILKRAQKKGLVSIIPRNIRDFSLDKHKTVDDRPYGGGVGMIMRVDVVERAINGSRIKNYKSRLKEKVVLLDPKGRLFNQPMARKFIKLDHLILVCGHYEGIDARISNFVDETISIGKYILTGGEIPAMVITDAIIRLLPGVLIKKQAIINESFSKSNILEAPQYTRPAIYKNLKVPQVLTSGDHKKISIWHKQQTGKLNP